VYGPVVGFGWNRTNPADKSASDAENGVDPVPFILYNTPFERE
jgi:hypothetical protein